MIALLGASAITLVALQATINAPTAAFRGCLKESSVKATNEKVAAEAIEGYLQNACSVQMGTLKSAVAAFRTKNGMGRKAAAEDAEMTVQDYVATTVEKYQFMAELNAPKPAAEPAQAVQATPASAPQTPQPEGQ